MRAPSQLQLCRTVRQTSAKHARTCATTVLMRLKLGSRVTELTTTNADLLVLWVRHGGCGYGSLKGRAAHERSRDRGNARELVGIEAEAPSSSRTGDGTSGSVILIGSARIKPNPMLKPEKPESFLLVDCFASTSVASGCHATCPLVKITDAQLHHHCETEPEATLPLDPQPACRACRGVGGRGEP